MNKVDVSIIFVNYKSPEMTLNAVDSVIANSQGFSYEIIVVDNSDDKQEFEKLNNLLIGKANVIDAKGNLGFGKGNNVGANVSNGDYLYFLNNDTLLEGNAIYELFDYIKNHDDVGVVGSNLYTKDKRPNHSYSKWEKNLKAEKRLFSIPFMEIHKIMKKRIDFNYSDMPLQINGYVCGASLMIRRDAFNKIGGFEKDIFMYAEEALLCYKVINELGYKIYNIPTSKIVHFEGGTESNETPSKIKMIIDGNYIYYQKAFSDDIAKKYLKLMIKLWKKRNFIAVITRKNKKHLECLNKINAYKEKLKLVEE